MDTTKPPTWKENRKEYKAMKELERYYRKRDEIRAKQNAKRLEDVEAFNARNRAYNAKWREENREAVRARARAHAKTPKGRDTAYAAKAARRAREQGSKIERIDWKHVWERFDGTCAICKKPLDIATEAYHRDHAIPLTPRGDNEPGPHTTENIQISHASCNRSKGNREVGVLYPPKPKAPKKKYVNTPLDKERQKAWRLANPDKQREFERLYRERHKEKIRLRHKEWVKANRDKLA
jgi:5-methylcytosine-specific restriction endonuclease McrA